ncbi:Putative transcriptional regulator, RpiR/GlvR family (HTH and SIS (Phosphosugar-binding) domains) (fragment) [Cupriavidus taiwanensis]
MFSDVEEDSEVYTPMTSRISHLVLGDVLAAGVALARADTVAPRLQRAKAHLRERRIAGAEPAPARSRARAAAAQTTTPAPTAARPSRRKAG